MNFSQVIKNVRFHNHSYDFFESYRFYFELKDHSFLFLISKHEKEDYSVRLVHMSRDECPFCSKKVASIPCKKAKEYFSSLFNTLLQHPDIRFQLLHSRLSLVLQEIL